MLRIDHSAEIIPLTSVELHRRSGAVFSERLAAFTNGGIGNGKMPIIARPSVTGGEQLSLIHYINPFHALLKRVEEEGLPKPEILSICLSYQSKLPSALNRELEEFFVGEPNNYKADLDYSDLLAGAFYRHKAPPYVGLIENDHMGENDVKYAAMLYTGSLLVGSIDALKSFVSVLRRGLHHHPYVSAEAYPAVTAKSLPGVIWMAAACEMIQAASVEARNSPLDTRERKEHYLGASGLVDINKGMDNEIGIGERMPNPPSLLYRRYRLKQPSQPT